MTNILSVALASFVLGFIVHYFWKAARPHGHAVFGVENHRVQTLVVDIIEDYTTLRRFFQISSYPTHQQVLTGGRVIAWFDDMPGVKEQPKNVCALVVNRKSDRREAAEKLVSGLKKLGYEASISQPMPGFPLDTFILVISNAFDGCGFAFRPNGLVMAFLTWKSKRKDAKR